MGKRQRVTLKDIAAKTGFDPVSVSRALRGIRELSPENTERVLKTAAKMGYRPNSFAQAMKSGRMDNVALVQGTEDPRNSTISHLLLMSIGRAVERRAHRLILAQIDDDQLNAAEYAPRILNEWIADGIFLSFNCYQPPGLFERLRQFRIPAIWLNCRLDADCIVFDDLGAGRMATEHLLSLGHRRIAYAACAVDESNPMTHYSEIDRFGGYRQAMVRAGLAPLPFFYDFHQTGDVGRVVAWMREHRPTAVVAYSFPETLPMVMAARTLGWRIPQDFSLLPVTTEAPGGMEFLYGLCYSYIGLHPVECGEIAVDALFRKIAEPGKRLAPVTVPYVLSLSDRDETTVAPPPAEVMPSGKASRRQADLVRR